MILIVNECGGKVSIFDLFENHLISQLKPATDRFRPIGTLQYGAGTNHEPRDCQPKLLTPRPGTLETKLS
jgi:hypothetical protein